MGFLDFLFGNKKKKTEVKHQQNKQKFENLIHPADEFLRNTIKYYHEKEYDKALENANKAIALGEEDLPGYVFNNNLMRLRVNKDINPLFIFYQLIGPKLRKDMIAEKKATTSICALYQRDLFPLKVKVIPSLEEQAQIVKEIESRLSVCDAVEQQIKDSLSQTEALRQSILKKAFEGKLLTEEEIKACQQAPDYEPAAVLLEKIKAEKEANKPVKKTKKK